MGNLDISTYACEQPDGYVFNSNDSDDTNDGSGCTTACDTVGEEAQCSRTEIENMREAMVDFRSSLSTELLDETSVCLDDKRFYLWHNTPANDDNRDGITYGDLSSDGCQKVYEITELSEGWLSEIMSSVWSSSYYSIDMF
ncbi:DUF3500 domain-containing protein [Polaribacter sp. Asnod1-A03]|uniref:DUF3500 domain-containing protein n=1 Tax=Polaribacter sp. Asnod1-A03 TaxID=3160581 RepID=UPI00386FD15C